MMATIHMILLSASFFSIRWPRFISKRRIESRAPLGAEIERLVNLIRRIVYVEYRDCEHTPKAVGDYICYY